MTVVLALAAAGQPIVPSPILETTDTDPCADFTQLGSLDGTDRRVGIDDLASVADIGPAIAENNARSVGISPGGDRIAFVVKRANPRTNAYCQQLLVVSASDSGEVLEVARGGAYLHADFALRDFSVVRAGWDVANPPRWSPSGNRIAYLRREGPTNQVWIVDPSGEKLPTQVTAMADDVDDFAWTEDGHGLVVTTRPGLREAMSDIGEEGRSGYLFDGRFSPQFADHPIATGPLAYAYTFVSLLDGSRRSASKTERDLLAPDLPPQAPANARAYRPGPGGRSAWLEPDFSDRIVSPTHVVVVGPDGQRRICESSVCNGVQDMWWSSDGGALILQQRTGWARGETALLRWEADDRAPRRIFGFEGLLIGCVTLRHELVCGQEASTQPRRLVAIDTRSGTERVIYDPNARLRNKDFGEVRRLRFRNAYGIESFADLVLPPGREEGQQHPMVVVQYSSHGFLRGGTGDEVPIYPLTAHGFAVLSFQRPGLLPAASKARNEIETRTLLADPWEDRRHVFATLEEAIDMAIATGAVDPDRLGIDGFSDAGATVQFALINSDLFKVATFGTCCQDMTAQPLAAGPRFADYFRAMGYRYFESDDEGFWQPISLLENARAIDTPILIQAADSEYEGALDVVEAFTNRDKAIELRVLPDETHYKWQPAHRRAIYERNLEWFGFWLNNERNCTPGKDAQYERWLAMEGAPMRSELRCSDTPTLVP